MVEKAKILVIDDEPQIRETIKYILGDRFEVFLAENGVRGVELASLHLPDAILLDVLMDSMDGFQTCEAIRREERLVMIPIIMLTAVNSVGERVRAFKSGADDYISKPFFPEELFARIESKIRRSKTVVGTHLGDVGTRCGNLTLYPKSKEVKLLAKSVSLTILEFNLLKYLIDNRGALLSREDIIESVWGTRDVATHILNPHILSIRRKLEGFDHELATVYGGGYILKPQEGSTA